MKISLFVLLLCSTFCFGVETNTLGEFTYSLPAGWSVKSEQMLNGSLPSVTLKNDHDALAITMLATDAPMLQSQEQLDQFLKRGARQLEEGSVEGKTTILHLASPHLMCSYANHTDKKLVNTPIPPDNWKYTTLGFVKINSSLLYFTYFTNSQEKWEKGEGLDIIKTFRSGSAETAITGSFSYALKDHKVTISVPEIPQIKLADHPLQKSQPHLRYTGSSAPYHVSVLTPTIDKGMSSLEFADFRIKQLAKMYALTKLQYKPYRQADSDSYSMFYSLQTDGIVQLHAHLFSVSPRGTHGIEVHISKTAKNEADVSSWLQGFPKAQIK
jgi:hypothetical protein